MLRSRMKLLSTLFLAALFFGLMVTVSYDLGLREDVMVINKKTERVTETAEVAVKDAIVNPISHARDRYPWKRGIATVFWVGEVAGPENAHIANAMSAFDMEWETHYGGYDDPENRCGYYPCAFTPHENPFYVALPYSDFEDDGTRRSNAKDIPWYDPAQTKSNVKNRWVEIKSGANVCFAQWQDVGPLEENDFEYVFGDAQAPLNTFGEKAGIDVSPAVRDCLQIDGSHEVSWRHVDDAYVPQGPWKDIITTSR